MTADSPTVAPTAAIAGGALASQARAGAGGRLLRVLLVAGVAFVALFVLLLAAAVAERVAYRGRVLPGVEASTVPLGGDTEREALRRLQAVGAALETDDRLARAGGTELVLAPAAVGLRLDEEATVRAARRAGRERNPLAVMAGAVLRRVRPDTVDLRVAWDDDRLGAVLDSWSEQVGTGLENGGLRFEGANVVEVAPRRGTGLPPEETRARVERWLGTAAPGVLRLRTGEVDPPIGAAEVSRAARDARALLTATVTVAADTAIATLAPDQLGGLLATEVEGRRLVLTLPEDRLRAALAPALATVEKPAVDAGWDTRGATAAVVPSQPGRVVDLAAVGGAILRGERQVLAPFRDVAPARDTAWAQRLNITELVSSFTTNHPAGQERVKNIHLGADLVDGVVVEPGQTFSLNEFLGPRTPDKGWVQAPVFSTDDGFFDDYGGGLSQLTTTMYNAVFFGGYRDVAHTPHSIYISRYPMGREATLNYGSIDLRFQNDTSAGLLIRTSYTSSSITVSFYGSK